MHMSRNITKKYKFNPDKFPLLWSYKVLRKYKIFKHDLKVTSRLPSYSLYAIPLPHLKQNQDDTTATLLAGFAIWKGKKIGYETYIYDIRILELQTARSIYVRLSFQCWSGHYFWNLWSKLLPKLRVRSAVIQSQLTASPKLFYSNNVTYNTVRIFKVM